MARAPKKTPTKLTKSQELKVTGGKIPKNEVLDKIATAHSLSFMSRYYEYSDAMEYLSEYLPVELRKKLAKMPKYVVPQTAGWIARFILNGCTVMDTSQEYLQKAINLIKEYEIVEEPKKSVGTIKSYENNQIILLETLLDKILMGEKIEFDATTHFKVNETSATDLKAIKEYYSGCKEQLLDKANKEYFKHSPAIMKNLVDFYRDIEDSIDIIQNNKIRERKPRKAKAKSATKLVSKLRFMKESAELKVSSLAVEKVVTSEQVLIFNTKYNTLIMLYALPGKKLAAHRTAIKDIDPERSVQKVLRKPEVNINKFTIGSKTTINKAFRELKTVEKKIDSFLTNENLLLLRCF